MTDCMLIDKQVKNLSGVLTNNEMQEYNDYILSDEFKAEYEKLKNKYYPNADPAHYFDDVMMFDNEGNLIKYPEYKKLYLSASSRSKDISEGK